MKICTKCKIEKSLDNFGVDSARKSGLNPWCRECKSKSQLNFRTQHREKYLKAQKESAKRNYNPKKEYIRSKIYIENNREKVKAFKRAYYEKNKDILAEKRKEKYPSNKRRLNEYATKRRNSNPLHKLSNVIRARVHNSLKRGDYTKNNNTFEMIGVSIEILKKYIERQFTKGMTWKNQGRGPDKWHIDHIIPISSAKTEDDLIKLFHYTNLRPLWEIENISKGAKIITTQMKIVM